MVLPALSKVAPVLNPFLNRLFRGIRGEGEEFTPRVVRHPTHGLVDEEGGGQARWPEALRDFLFDWETVQGELT